MRARGKVTKKQGSLAWVEVCHKETCVGCGMHNPEDTMAEVQCTDPIGVSIGERVEFEVNRSKMLGVMVLVFWLPLILGGLGAWAGYNSGESLQISPIIFAVIFGIIGLVIGALIVYIVGRKTNAGTGLRILRIVPDSEALCANIGSTDLSNN